MDLAGFANEILRLSAQGLDQYDIEEIAVNHGVMLITVVDKPCSKFCACALAHGSGNFPVNCRSKNPELIEPEEPEPCPSYCT